MLGETSRGHLTSAFEESVHCVNAYPRSLLPTPHPQTPSLVSWTPLQIKTAGSFPESLGRSRLAGLSLREWPALLKMFALIRIFPISSSLFLQVLETDPLHLLRVKPLTCPLVPISQGSCFHNLPPHPPPSGRKPYLCLLIEGLLSQS